MQGSESSWVATPSTLSSFIFSSLPVDPGALSAARRPFWLSFGRKRNARPKVSPSIAGRWLEYAGNSLGASVVEAARREALRTAVCLATDATGISVQPIRTHEKVRQACRHAHFFVQIADRDHVFFEYTPRETSKAVYEMFRGFSGYVQADAKSGYDLLFREPRPDDDVEPDGATREEVGCWAHLRRKVLRCRDRNERHRCS
jgi:hypothetical protein